jgi:uncharacterized damage-inducible protein DinB
MEKDLTYVSAVRKSILRAVHSFSDEQLNIIPAGFNNNIIWNLAHMIAAQQELFYIHSGLAVRVDPKYYQDYRIGTKPEEFVGHDEIIKIEELFRTTLDWQREDFRAGMFDHSADMGKLIRHFVFHEGIHFGYIMSLRRMLFL